jgi:hypothetical protein
VSGRCVEAKRSGLERGCYVAFSMLAPGPLHSRFPTPPADWPGKCRGTHPCHNGPQSSTPIRAPVATERSAPVRQRKEHGRSNGLDSRTDVTLGAVFALRTGQRWRPRGLPAEGGRHGALAWTSAAEGCSRLIPVTGPPPHLGMYGPGSLGASMRRIASGRTPLQPAREVQSLAETLALRKAPVRHHVWSTTSSP